MELHRGRLIDHIQLRCADLTASKRFYATVLAVLGRELVELAPGLIVADELCLTPASRDSTSRVHLAFQTDSRAVVERFHAAALAAGGRDNGGPAERRYHPGYYAAFVLDPDGEATRSAPSILITPAAPPHA
jgi:catechol 2,3-dioxygenase-like lactoylglutathione lyase family enzyme